MRPKKLNIAGVIHTVKYVASPQEVDIHGREVLLGQIDYLTHSIRVLDDKNKEAIDRILFHEILHGITESMGIDSLSGEEHHLDLDRLAVVLADTLNRNRLLKD